MCVCCRVPHNKGFANSGATVSGFPVDLWNVLREETAGVILCIVCKYGDSNIFNASEYACMLLLT